MCVMFSGFWLCLVCMSRVTNRPRKYFGSDGEEVRPIGRNFGLLLGLWAACTARQVSCLSASLIIAQPRLRLQHRSTLMLTKSLALTHP